MNSTGMDGWKGMKRGTIRGKNEGEEEEDGVRNN